MRLRRAHRELLDQIAKANPIAWLEHDVLLVDGAIDLTEAEAAYIADRLPNSVYLRRPAGQEGEQ